MTKDFALLEAFALIAEAVDEFNNIGCDDLASHFEKKLIDIQNELFKSETNE